MDTNETIEPTEDKNEAQATDAPKEVVEQAASAEAPEAAPEATAEVATEEAVAEAAEAVQEEEETVIAEAEPVSNIPDFGPGDTIKVNVKVIEGTKERIQAFEGVVMRIRNNTTGGNFTVRRVSHGVGVERTFLFDSPRVDSVEVKKLGKVRRAKLYYLRNFKWKLPRIKEKRY